MYDPSERIRFPGVVRAVQGFFSLGLARSQRPSVTSASWRSEVGRLHSPMGGKIGEKVPPSYTKRGPVFSENLNWLLFWEDSISIYFKARKKREKTSKQILGKAAAGDWAVLHTFNYVFSKEMRILNDFLDVCGNRPGRFFLFFVLRPRPCRCLKYPGLAFGDHPSRPSVPRYRKIHKHTAVLSLRKRGLC